MHCHSSPVPEHGVNSGGNLSDRTTPLTSPLIGGKEKALSYEERVG